MKLLLDDRYAPITSCLCFVEAGYAQTVEAFRAENEEHIEKWQDGSTLKARKVSSPLAHALETLLPLTVPVTLRHLFVPTANWTAYFSNFRLGSASLCVSSLARRLKCRGLGITAVPDTMGTSTKSLYDKTKRGRYGGSQFALYGPEQTHFLNLVRAIDCTNDGGRWKFDAGGTPQPFEEPEAYKARRVRDKLPFELLDKYCRALGMRPFDEDFYLPPGHPTATLFELGRPPTLKVTTFTLAQVQEDFGGVGTR